MIKLTEPFVRKNSLSDFLYITLGSFKALYRNRLSGCPCVQQSAVHQRLGGDNPGCPWPVLPHAVCYLLEKSIALSDGTTMRFPCLCTDGLFTVRERLRCSSRTTALLFANDRAALREQPRCSSRTANESIKRNRGKRFVYSGERQVILYISSCNIVQIHIGLIYIKHISVKSSRTTRGQPGLSLFTD